MNQTEYESLKAKIAKDRQKASERRAKLDARIAKLEQDEEALDRVWQLLGNEPMDNGYRPSQAPTTFAEAKQKTRRGELIRTVRQIIDQLAPEEGITSDLIRERISSDNPQLLNKIHRSSIPSTLNQLASDGVLELVKRGRGREVGIYKRRGEGITTAKSE